MSHHKVVETSQINEQERDANSRVDVIAMLALVAIVVTMAVYFASR